jgi:CRISPR/Cas system CSM-associated protein Csm3 (group 7 of RAMP superfamily)
MYQVIIGKLEARTAIHIGSGQGDNVTDALVRRDVFGQSFIPGTSIAGALRALLTRLAPRFGFDHCCALSHDNNSCQCGVCHLFGDINPSDQPGSKSSVSRLSVFDARPEDLEIQTVIRDGVGIDRITGTAARSAAAKFNLEVIAAGSQFELRIELHDLSPEDEQLLTVGLTEWQSGRLWLGGQVARGLGAFYLIDLEYKILRLDTPEGLLNYLNCDEPWREAVIQSAAWFKEKLDSLNILSSQGQPNNTILRGWLELTGTLQADGVMLANDTLASGISGFDHAPLQANLCGWRQPVLPGAGLRGVLRSHAERLARTLVAFQSGVANYSKRCPACDPNVRDKPGGTGLPLESCDSLLRKIEKANRNLKTGGNSSCNTGDIEDSLCLACRLFGSPRQGSRLIVEDAPYISTPQQETPEYKMLDFLAIDRFTGGGADKLKFDAVALWKPAFNFQLYLENPAPWELGWLCLVLRDLMEGWLRVGFGGAKGFGCMKLMNWQAKFGFILPEDMPDLAKLGLTGQKDGVYTAIEVSEAVQGYDTILQQWIGEFHKKIKSFSRSDGMQLREENYFSLCNELYPVLRGGTQ